VSRRIRSAFVLAAAIAAAVGVAMVGQEPILSFSLDEESIGVSQGGTAIVVLHVENESVYQADEIEPTLAFEGIALRVEPEEIEVLSPFAAAAFALAITVAEDMPLGTMEPVVEIVYTYCIGELCYQIAEEIPFSVTVEPPPVGPVETPIEDPVEIPIVPPVESSAAFWFRLGALGFGFVLLAAALAIRRTTAKRWPLVAVVGLIAVAGLAYGVALDQHEQAQGIGAVLCTSCVGIEVAQHGQPELSAAGIAAIEAIDREIELLVFYAEWCHACPYAEKMVERVAERNPRIGFRFVDVEAEPELAEESGVIQSGRTIVPAILRTDTGEIVFGAEDLEARLIDLLGGTP
jgi:thiol-disulfide isomerase/thioredoxin